MPCAVSFQISLERSRFLPSMSPSRAWRSPKPGTETDGNPLKTLGSGAPPWPLPPRRPSAWCSNCFPCGARKPFSWQDPTPGRLKHLGRTASHTFSVWSGRPRWAHRGPEHSLQMEGKAAAPGRPRVARGGVHCLPRGLVGALPPVCRVAHQQGPGLAPERRPHTLHHG